MRKHHALNAVLFIALCAPVVCWGAATVIEHRIDSRSDTPSASRLYAPAPNERAMTQDGSKEAKDKKRGNTPIGMDRTGAGPADGAIVDPKGVLSKRPLF